MKNHHIPPPPIPPASFRVINGLGTIFWVTVVLAVIQACCGQAAFPETLIHPGQVRTPFPGSRQLVWSEFLATRLSDGSYLIPPATIYSNNVVTMGPTVYRNNKRMLQPGDFTIDPVTKTRFVPTLPWLPTDVVLIEYWQVLNGGPSVSPVPTAP